MPMTRERTGRLLAALALAINLSLSLMHFGLLGGIPAVQRDGRAAAVASTEVRLLNALAEICTEHGLAKHHAKGPGQIFSACPLCGFFASVVVVLAAAQLLLILRAAPLGRLAPPRSAGSFISFVARPSQPRAPPYQWIAA